jgi:D-glycero-alpha-D-manno-heptose-7-phosphate kinase
MIITRTPFRISFFGGGTDFPAFYREHGGAVLSTTINKYCYIMTRELPPFFEYKYRIRYTQREETGSIDAIRHPVVREVLQQMQLPYGIEMVHTSDIPAMSGIGSSSAFTVGFLQGMQALSGRITSKRQLADWAIDIEQNKLHENVGSQDQIAVAFGGFNRIDFGTDGNYYVNPITIASSKVEQLQQSCLLFFTGFTRNSSVIQSSQLKRMRENTPALLEMRALVDESCELLNSDGDLSGFGRLLDQSWQLKRRLSNLVSNESIDTWYAQAKNAGALGGKILGAGGGGFLLIFAEPDAHAAIKQALSELLYVPFAFENTGSHISMYSTINYSGSL